ncbi:MAG: Rrf2 family transcriptional regulator [Proteobacteria bacterium]|nr:Rrf2 family transcriptional regulator [Pseudomonadota bacterium]MBQ9242272.1 Rrf2 family transcriptional regulator [Pseudomonadota bacterium]
MKISTRGRYALRVMIDLAEHANQGYTPMKVIAERQGISLKYLEQIVPVLSRSELICGIQGKGGGYKLNKHPDEVTVGEVLRLTEGDLAPVACLECDAKPCERTGICRTLPMWKAFNDMINHFFDSITLSKLMKDKDAQIELIADSTISK